MNSFRGMGLGSGIILAIIGIILFAFPTLSTMVFAMLVGFGILVVGINATYTWFSTLRGTGMGAGVLATGILSIIFGLLCLLFPLAFAEAVIWFVAIAVIVFGIAQIISLITTRDINGRFVGILGSLIVVICGILALIWPPFVMQFIGASLLIEGITVIVMSLIPLAHARALPFRNRAVPYRYLCHQDATCVKPRCHARSVIWRASRTSHPSPLPPLVAKGRLPRAPAFRVL